MFLLTILIYCLVPDGAGGNDESCKWDRQSNGRCYFLSDRLWNLGGARTQCQACSGRLATAKSPQEVGILLNVTQQHTIALIGLSLSVYFTGFVTWYWDDGDYLSWTNWFPGQPDNIPPAGGSEHCTEILTNGKWCNILCRAKRQFICEKPGPDCTNVGK